MKTSDSQNNNTCLKPCDQYTYELKDGSVFLVTCFDASSLPAPNETAEDRTLEDSLLRLIRDELN